MDSEWPQISDPLPGGFVVTAHGSVSKSSALVVILVLVAAVVRDGGISEDIFLIGRWALCTLAAVGFFASLSLPRFRVIRNEYFGAMYLTSRRLYESEGPSGLTKG